MTRAVATNFYTPKVLTFQTDREIGSGSVSISTGWFVRGFKASIFFVQKADDFLGEFHELLLVLFCGGKSAKFHPFLAIFHKSLVY